MVVCELLHVLCDTFFVACWDILWQMFLFLSIVCSDSKNIVLCMLVTSLMNQNKFSLEVTNAVIARIQFFPVGALCDASKRIFFLSIYAVIARIRFSL